MLEAEYYRFERSTGHVAHRTASYTLPPEVSRVVDFVEPTTRLPTVRTVGRDTVESPDSSNLNTPKVLRKLYSVGDEVGNATGNKQAVTAFLEQYFSASDQAEFNALFSRPNVGVKLALKGDATTGSVRNCICTRMLLGACTYERHA